MIYHLGLGAKIIKLSKFDPSNRFLTKSTYNLICNTPMFLKKTETSKVILMVTSLFLEDAADSMDEALECS